MVDSLVADRVWVEDGDLLAATGPLVLRLHASERDAAALCGTSVTVHTRLELSDDAVALVGFAGRERRSLYDELRRVSGIGRASALAVLACGESVDVLRAAVREERAFLSQVPGVGPKRLDAIFAHLRRSYRGVLPPAPDYPVAWLVEAREAIVHLGVDPVRADAVAVSMTPADPEDLLQQLRRALA